MFTPTQLIFVFLVYCPIMSWIAKLIVELIAKGSRSEQEPPINRVEVLIFGYIGCPFGIYVAYIVFTTLFVIIERGPWIRTPEFVLSFIIAPIAFTALLMVKFRGRIWPT